MFSYKRKKQIVSVVIVLMAIWWTLMFALVGHALEGGKKEIVSTESYQVQPGDTLWSIAESYPHDGVEIRRFIYDIRELNGTDPVIHVGQTIAIPVYEGGVSDAKTD